MTLDDIYAPCNLFAGRMIRCSAIFRGAFGHTATVVLLLGPAGENGAHTVLLLADARAKGQGGEVTQLKSWSTYEASKVGEIYRSACAQHAGGPA